MSVNVLNNHNDTFNTGANTAEIQLTPTNVKVGSFGKLFATTVDGQVYAQPLVDTGVTIGGAVHNVVFVATENDSLYAIDSSTGAVLWQRSFITTSESNGILNNPLGATSVTTVSASDVDSSDITPTIGITSTPVIDPARNLIYLVAATKEVVGGTTYFVQRLHAINIANGTDAVAPYQIGQTSGTNTNTTSIYVYGDGDGYVTDPYNNTGKDVVQFNALTENQRTGLSLVNNTVYVSWASHGDNGPYHGWVVTWNVANITTSGFVLSGVLNTCPNDGESGIWQSGGGLVFEPDDSAFYFLTGNGTGEAPTLGSNGLPINANYNEALVKAETDSTTSPTNQNPNGWGLKIVDFFIPYNVAALDGADSDFGSGAPLLIPTAVNINGVATNLIVVGGKDGRLFVLNRNNLGHYNATSDAALNSVLNANGDSTPPVADAGTLSTPAWYNGHLYVISGYSGSALEFSITSNGSLATVSQTSLNFGYEPGSPSISSNGSSNGIVWLMDRNLNELHAYDANTLNTELWNSSQVVNGTDATGALVKFANPTIANGEVFVGTSSQLIAYGLTPAASKVSNAPVLAATTLSGSAINLTWTDSSVAPNQATAYLIEESTDGSSFTQITTAPAGATSIGIGGLNASTPYYFRIRGFNSIGDSNYSNISSATTSAQSASINFSSGFASAAATMKFNGSAAIAGSNLQLTDLNDDESGSAFSSTAVDVTHFTSQFAFQLSSGNTADGFTFALQNVGPAALGDDASGLGYQSIVNSVALKFDLYNNAGEGFDSTGLFSAGAAPTSIGSIDLTSTGLNLHSGDPFLATLSYDGTTLTVNLEDTTTGVSATQSYAVNIPSLVGAGTAYVGFTGGTGGVGCVQDIENWTYTPGDGSSPNAPTGLGGTPATATSVTLNWTNNALNQTGYHLDRATDAGFTQNLITETLPASPSSFTDTTSGLAPGGTYYYRLRAFDSVGDSGNSNVASVTIPVAPPRATDQTVTGVSTNEIDLSWQDNAGHLAEGYQILRSVNQGTFSVIATLPPTSRTAPSTYTWSDTNLTPGTFYEYHIEAYNTSGYNDFAGTNATTITSPPTGLTAVATSGGVNLSWSATTGAVSYNLYRGTTSGGEALTPIATGITGTTYTDTTATQTGTYYYELTAINANAGDTPQLPSESTVSAEASTAVGTSAKLTGTVIGTTGSYDGTSTRDKAFDGNTATYFDAATANGDWTGLDLGSPYSITSISYQPRSGWESRMTGGMFQESSTADFSSNVITLATISTQPAANVYTTISGLTGSAYRYVRYLSPNNGYGNVAEINFYGTSGAAAVVNPPGTPTITTVATSSTVGISWAASTSSGVTSYIVLRTNGSTTQSFTTPSTTLSDSGLSASTTYSYTVEAVAGTTTSAPSGALTVTTAAASTTSSKLTGTVIGTTGSYDGTSTRDKAFDGNTATYFDAPTANGDWTGLDLGSPYTITSISYQPRSGWESRMTGGMFQESSTADFSSNVVTLATISTQPAANVYTTISGLTGSAYRYVRYLSPNNGYGNVAEIDFYGTSGAAAVVNPPGTPSITTAATSSTVGISWAASTSSGVTSYIVLRTSGGATQSFTTTSTTFSDSGLSASTTYSYTVEAVAGATTSTPSGALSVTTASATPVSSQLTGTVIGTTGSYDGTSTRDKAFDGNTATYFDAPTGNGDWVGLDLGTARTITSISYQPRSGFEYRMTGGVFQVSSTADFSSNVITLATISTQPAANVYTTIGNLSAGGAYRYVRYLSPNNGYGNVAEIDIDGY